MNVGLLQVNLIFFFGGVLERYLPITFGFDICLFTNLHHCKQILKLKLITTYEARSSFILSHHYCKYQNIEKKTLDLNEFLRTL